MFNELYDSPSSELFKQRLEREEAELRGMSLTTREDYQAEVFSRLNRILKLGNNVSPLRPVKGESPAAAGDVERNLTILNDDAQSIVTQLLNIQGEAARLFNLFASTQNSLRQEIRETVFAATRSRWQKALLNKQALEKINATVDFNAGSVALQILSTTELTPARVLLGSSSSARPNPTWLF